MSKHLPLIFAAALLTANAGLHAQEASKAPGSISGTVLNSAGGKASGVQVKLYAPIDPTGGGPVGSGGSRGRTVWGAGPGYINLLQRGAPPTAVATTDAEGKFTFKTVKPGSYEYRAGAPTTVGYAFGNVTVESGKNATVEIKLDAPAR